MKVNRLGYRLACCGLLSGVAMAPALPSTAGPAVASTFRNPICPAGADPQIAFEGGCYYYIKSVGNRALALLKARDVTAMSAAEQKVIWTPPAGTSHSRELWAPEIHRIDGKWYVYYTADDGNNDNHRMYELESASADPMAGQFVMKSRLKTDPNDNWAIDPTVFEAGGANYIVWSGWPIRTVGVETACIYIARLKNPWTIGSERVMISQPEFEWERHWKNPPEWHKTPAREVNVNEGPAVLRHGNRIFLTYSASGCWTPFYCLGMLTADAGADLLEPSSWRKSDKPVFQQSPADHVFGPGHNSFFKSPDGTEDWLVYHANDNPEDCGGPNRSPRIQRIEWNKDGTPDFGVPKALTEEIVKPSGL